jgi:toxin YoeB
MWSKRINQEHRIVYKVDDDIITVYSLRFHYIK